MESAEGQKLMFLLLELATIDSAADGHEGDVTRGFKRR